MFSAEERQLFWERNDYGLIDKHFNELVKQAIPTSKRIYGKCQQFDITPSDAPYIQNIHAGLLHWICVTNTTATTTTKKTT